MHCRCFTPFFAPLCTIPPPPPTPPTHPPNTLQPVALEHTDRPWRWLRGGASGHARKSCQRVGVSFFLSQTFRAAIFFSAYARTFPLFLFLIIQKICKFPHHCCDLHANIHQTRPHDPHEKKTGKFRQKTTKTRHEIATGFFFLPSAASGRG